MPEPKGTMLWSKVSESNFLVIERAVALERTTVSAFIREAVLPVARETIVRHAIKSPLPNVAA